MATTHEPLESITPAAARDLFLKHKQTTCADATVQSYRYRMNHFVEWCEQEDIDDCNTLSGRDIHEFRIWREAEGDLNRLTLRTNLDTLRVFLKWAATIEAVPPNLHEKVMIPHVEPANRKRDETLGAETAEAILDRLAQQEYGSLRHTSIAVLWETGIRIGALVSLDRSDVDRSSGTIYVRHGPDEGTTLKNKESGERPIAITDDLTRLLEEYIDHHRIDMTDEYGREPLFSSREGRRARSKHRENVYEVTAPCFRDEPCPDCHGGTVRRCAESVSPHAIRRGSITHFLASGVPEEVVSDRMNVSRKVLKKHYDRRSPEEKMEQRRGYLDSI